MIGDKLIPLLTHEEFPPARLVAEEKRVREWFDSLPEIERQRTYTLAEIRAAVGLPATTLRVVLRRMRWEVRQDSAFGVSTFRGPYETDAERVIRKL
jgi:hypothetical protein